jgi:hypothetical protein
MIVSDLFVDIYTNFNVCSQVNKIKNLRRPERLLILMSAVDFDINNEFVSYNFRNFKNEIEILKQLYLHRNPQDYDLLSVLRKEKNRYDRIATLHDKNGNKLIPLTEEEAKVKRREYLINLINKR